MREIISFYIGQAGVQCGMSIWELFCCEHQISKDGHLVERTHGCENIETFFQKTAYNTWVPRALFVDLEPTVIDEIRSGSYKKLFHPDRLMNGPEDAANNFSRGFFTVGKLLLGSISSEFRHLVEQCDMLQGMLLLRSLGGGTGAGLTSAMFESLSDYPKTPKIEVPIYPSPTLSSSMVEPYNCLLGEHFCMEDIDVGLLLDNEAMFDLCSRYLSLSYPTYNTINRLIAQIASSITASVRFENVLNCDLTVLQTNMVPYPRIHFPLCNFAPILSLERAQHQKLSVQELTRMVFERENQMMKIDHFYGKFMSCALFYRGNVCPHHVYLALSEIKRDKSIEFVDWCPTGFKVGINAMNPCMIPDSQFAETRRNVAMLTNTSAIGQAWQRLTHRFYLLYSKRSFVHWFVGEGMEECEFTEALYNISALVKDYEEAGESSTNMYEYYNKDAIPPAPPLPEGYELNAETSVEPDIGEESVTHTEDKSASNSALRNQGNFKNIFTKTKDIAQIAIFGKKSEEEEYRKNSMSSIITGVSFPEPNKNRHLSSIIVKESLSSLQGNTNPVIDVPSDSSMVWNDIIVPKYSTSTDFKSLDSQDEVDTDFLKKIKGERKSDSKVTGFDSFRDTSQKSSIKLEKKNEKVPKKISRSIVKPMNKDRLYSLTINQTDDVILSAKSQKTKEYEKLLTNNAQMFKSKKPSYQSLKEITGNLDVLPLMKQKLPISYKVSSDKDSRETMGGLHISAKSSVNFPRFSYLSRSSKFSHSGIKSTTSVTYFDSFKSSNSFDDSLSNHVESQMPSLEFDVSVNKKTLSNDTTTSKLRKDAPTLSPKVKNTTTSSSHATKDKSIAPKEKKRGKSTSISNFGNENDILSNPSSNEMQTMSPLLSHSRSKCLYSLPSLNWPISDLSSNSLDFMNKTAQLTSSQPSYLCQNSTADPINGGVFEFTHLDDSDLGKSPPRVSQNSEIHLASIHEDLSEVHQLTETLPFCNQDFDPTNLYIPANCISSNCDNLQPLKSNLKFQDSIFTGFDELLQTAKLEGKYQPTSNPQIDQSKSSTNSSFLSSSSSTGEVSGDLDLKLFESCDHTSSEKSFCKSCKMFSVTPVLQTQKLSNLTNKTDYNSSDRFNLSPTTSDCIKYSLSSLSTNGVNSAKPSQLSSLSKESASNVIKPNECRIFDVSSSSQSSKSKLLKFSLLSSSKSSLSNKAVVSCCKDFPIYSPSSNDTQSNPSDCHRSPSLQKDETNCDKLEIPNSPIVPLQKQPNLEIGSVKEIDLYSERKSLDRRYKVSSSLRRSPSYRKSQINSVSRSETSENNLLHQQHKPENIIVASVETLDGNVHQHSTEDYRTSITCSLTNPRRSVDTFKVTSEYNKDSLNESGYFLPFGRNKSEISKLTKSTGLNEAKLSSDDKMNFLENIDDRFQNISSNLVSANFSKTLNLAIPTESSGTESCSGDELEALNLQRLNHNENNSFGSSDKANYTISRTLQRKFSAIGSKNFKKDDESKSSYSITYVINNFRNRTLSNSHSGI